MIQPVLNHFCSQLFVTDFLILRIFMLFTPVKMFHKMLLLLLQGWPNEIVPRIWNFSDSVQTYDKLNHSTPFKDDKSPQSPHHGPSFLGLDIQIRARWAPTVRSWETVVSPTFLLLSYFADLLLLLDIPSGKCSLGMFHLPPSFSEQPRPPLLPSFSGVKHWLLQM